jgi:hypothetical protein
LEDAVLLVADDDDDLINISAVEYFSTANCPGCASLLLALDALSFLVPFGAIFLPP